MTQILLVVAGLSFAGIMGMFVLSMTSSRPTNLGVGGNGRLAEAPSSPNCVSTQTADRSHWIAPLRYTGSADVALAELKSIVERLPRTEIIEQKDGYLNAEFCSAIFRFVDDVEFLVEPESQRIHFRSASRVGRSDLGANRKRMELIRSMFDLAKTATQTEKWRLQTRLSQRNPS